MPSSKFIDDLIRKYLPGALKEDSIDTSLPAFTTLADFVEELEKTFVSYYAQDKNFYDSLGQVEASYESIIMIHPYLREHFDKWQSDKKLKYKNETLALNEVNILLGEYE